MRKLISLIILFVALSIAVFSHAESPKKLKSIWYGNSVMIEDQPVDIRHVNLSLELELYEDGTASFTAANLDTNERGTESGTYQYGQDVINLVFPSGSTQCSYTKDYLLIEISDLEFLFGKEKPQEKGSTDIIQAVSEEEFYGVWHGDRIMLGDVPYTPLGFLYGAQGFDMTLTVSDRAQIDLMIDRKIFSYTYNYEFKNGNLRLYNEMHDIIIMKTSTGELYVGHDISNLSIIKAKTIAIYFTKNKGTSQGVIAEKENENWICTSCGNSATGNFCSNCGSKKPTGNTESGTSEPLLQADFSSDTEELKYLLNYVFKPVSSGTVMSIIRMDDNHFSVLLSDHKTYSVMLNSKNKKGSYAIICTNLSSSNTEEVKSPYSYTDPELKLLFNFLMKKDGKTINSIIPLTDGIYTASDNDGKGYMVTINCSETAIMIGLEGK